jgi:hypothetical protein
MARTPNAEYQARWQAKRKAYVAGLEAENAQLRAEIERLKDDNKNWLTTVGHLQR